MALKLFGYNIQLTSNKDTKVQAATTTKRATGAIRKQPKREVSYEIKDIKTAEMLAGNPDTPDRGMLFDIYRYIAKDGHMISQTRTAKIKALSEPWLLYKEGDTPDLVASTLFRKQWFNQVLEYILEAEFYAYSLIECSDIDPATCEIGKIELIERKYVSIEKKWILIEGTFNGPYLPYGDLMQEMDLLEFGDGSTLGTLLECSYNVIWKYYSRSDWSRASEKFGMPILSITANTNDDTELDDLENRAANFGNDGYIIGQNGDNINIIERKGQKIHDIYKDNVILCNDEISKIINGNTATTDQQAYVGAADVHERTQADFTTWRLQKIVDAVNKIFIPYLSEKGFPIEGLHMDYPLLIELRNKRILGKQAPNDAPEEPIKE